MQNNEHIVLLPHDLLHVSVVYHGAQFYMSAVHLPHSWSYRNN